MGRSLVMQLQDYHQIVSVDDRRGADRVLAFDDKVGFLAACQGDLVDGFELRTISPNWQIVRYPKVIATSAVFGAGPRRPCGTRQPMDVCTVRYIVFETTRQK